MSYRQGKCPLKKGEKTGLILDKNTVEIIKKEIAKNPKKLHSYLENFVPIYIENFENTYNIFEQHKDFGKETEKLARRITAIQKNNPQMSKKKLKKTLKRTENLLIKFIITYRPQIRALES